MGKLDAQQVLVTEEMIKRYQLLNQQAKEIDKELTRLKNTFNQYFDLTVGKNEKAEISFDNFLLQRQVRISEKYRQQEAIQRLEELQLTDCIKVEKTVDDEKVKAAIALGLLPKDALEEFKERKYSSAIYVREI